MRFRSLLIAIPLMAVVAPPALAQDVEYVSGTGEFDARHGYYEDSPVSGDNDGMMAMADSISDPILQDSVAAVIEHTTGAVMNLPVGPFAEAIERARPGTVDRRIRRHSTVGDIAGRNVRDLPQELGDRSREAMGVMSGFARAMAVMMPEFERMGREMEDSLRAAKAEVRRNRY